MSAEEEAKDPRIPLTPPSRTVRPGEAIRQALDGLRAVGESVRAMRVVAAEIGRAIAPVIQLAQQWSEHFSAMPAKVEERLKTLARSGWFIDAEMSLPTIRRLHEAMSSGRDSEAEQWLSDYYRREGAAICERLCAHHPARAALILDAYRAHEEGRYALSIPVFLLQADGLAHDLGPNIQLFSKDVSRGVQRLLEALPAGSMERVFLSVFAENCVLVMNTKHLPPDFNGLNRHEVLHGSSVRYATEINSLRALSVLTHASLALRSAQGEAKGATSP